MLRKLTKTDLQEVQAIENIAQVAPWSNEVFQRCLGVGFGGWVIELQDRVIAFILASFQVEECHILNICVHPHYQHQGYGELLLNYVLLEAQNKQSTMACLEVRRSNLPALALYRKLGFVEIGERKGYYPTPDGREDALVLAKELLI